MHLYDGRVRDGGGGDARAVSSALAGRLRQVRVAHFGEEGIPEIARQLGLPELTWRNYEAGVTIPGLVILRFLALTRVDPGMLLTG